MVSVPGTWKFGEHDTDDQPGVERGNTIGAEHCCEGEYPSSVRGFHEPIDPNGGSHRHLGGLPIACGRTPLSLRSLRGRLAPPFARWCALCAEQFAFGD